MKNFNVFNQFYNKFIKYTPAQSNDFFITTETNKNIEKEPVVASRDFEPKDISSNFEENLNYMKYKYNSLINSDVVIREFSLIANNSEFKAFLIFIDGMVDTQVVNTSILKPLMLRHNANTSKKNYITNSTNSDNSSNEPSSHESNGGSSFKEIISEFNNNDVIIRKIKKFDLKNYIYHHINL